MTQNGCLFIYWGDKLDIAFKIEHGRDPKLGSTETDPRLALVFQHEMKQTLAGLSCFGFSKVLGRGLSASEPITQRVQDQLL